MKIMVETTEWSDGFTDACNHVYVFNDSMTKAIGYVPRGSKTLQKFKNPLSIDTRGRTFHELGDPDPPKPDVITRTGSKGEVYYITNEGPDYHCTCPGFKFRGSCKHVAEIQQERSGVDIR
jgi:hypothetical protein